MNAHTVAHDARGGGSFCPPDPGRTIMWTAAREARNSGWRWRGHRGLDERSGSSVNEDERGRGWRWTGMWGGRHRSARRRPERPGKKHSPNRRVSIDDLPSSGFRPVGREPRREHLCRAQRPDLLDGRCAGRLGGDRGRWRGTPGARCGDQDRHEQDTCTHRLGRLRCEPDCRALIVLRADPYPTLDSETTSG